MCLLSGTNKIIISMYLDIFVPILRRCARVPMCLLSGIYIQNISMYLDIFVPILLSVLDERKQPHCMDAQSDGRQC